MQSEQRLTVTDASPGDCGVEAFFKGRPVVEIEVPEEDGDDEEDDDGDVLRRRDLESEGSALLADGRAAHGDGALKVQKPRLPSLDVLRGGVVLAMVVANFQIPSAAYPLLLHSPHHPPTPVDLIFPLFLLSLGLSLPLSLSLRPRPTTSILLRSVFLFLIGLLLNDPLTPLIRSHSLHQFRPLGVLQRLAVVNAVVGGALNLLPWTLFMSILPAACLVLWTAVTYSFPIPGMLDARGNPCDVNAHYDPLECTAQSYVDLRVLGQSHIYRGGVLDPEGLVSTLTACVSGWLGCVAGVGLVRALRPDATDGGWRGELGRRV
ncbi:hypothetical protein HK101_006788, partial [Irineochytrium annulatum]